MGRLHVVQQELRADAKVQSFTGGEGVDVNDAPEPIVATDTLHGRRMAYIEHAPDDTMAMSASSGENSAPPQPGTVDELVESSTQEDGKPHKIVQKAGSTILVQRDWLRDGFTTQENDLYVYLPGYGYKKYEEPTEYEEPLGVWTTPSFFRYPDGCCCEAQSKDYQMHGECVWTWPDGLKFKGRCKNGCIQKDPLVERLDRIENLFQTVSTTDRHRVMYDKNIELIQRILLLDDHDHRIRQNPVIRITL